jgi:hypothetical protein
MRVILGLLCDSKVRFPDRVTYFSIHHTPKTSCGVYLASISVGTGVKSPGREAHSPPSSAKFKNACIYTSTPQMSSWRGA